MLLFISLLSFAWLASSSSTPAPSLTRRQNSPAYSTFTIDMPIDHYPENSRYEPHTKATFKQRYFFDSTYYKPGGPVFLYIGGETSGPSRFSNLQTGIIQILMQAFNGLGVILENRYYGQSFPFNTSTTDNLVYLSTEQTIADNAYFAQHANFPGINSSLNAPGTPWILYGGSLAGAQTAFSIKAHGDILFGGIASSGTIKAELAYPQWYDPIQRLGPSDCIASINGIIDKMDHVVFSDQTEAVQKLKNIFGLGALDDIRDFAMTIAFPLGGPMNYPTNTWQELNWNPAYGADDFWQFCQAVTNLNSPEDIKAVDFQLASYTNGEPWKNLGNYASYIKSAILPLCPGGDYDNVVCFGTQNDTFYADSTNSEGRSYLYTSTVPETSSRISINGGIACSEAGGYQVAPASGPSLISRVLQIDYTQTWCTWAFPAGEYNSIPETPDLYQYNKYGGFNFKADRLAFIDGDNDVWLDLCYHSHQAPRRFSSDLHPEYLISGAGHHWDSYGILNVTAEPQFIQQAHLWEIRTVRKWLESRQGKA